MSKSLLYVFITPLLLWTHLRLMLLWHYIYCSLIQASLTVSLFPHSIHRQWSICDDTPLCIVDHGSVFEKLGDNGTWLYSFITVYIWFPFSQLNDCNNSDGDCAATANCPHLTLIPKCCWRSHFTHLKNKNKMFGILISTCRRSLWLTPSLQYDVIFFPTCFQAAMSFANVLDPSLLLWTTVWVTVQKYKHPIGQLCHLVVRNPHF